MPKASYQIIFYLAFPLLLLTLPYSSFSEEYSKDFFRIIPSSISSGLSQKSILHISHGANSDLWFSTLDGVGRFNGNRLINYQPGELSTQFIASSKVSAIVESPSGKIFAATLDHGILEHDPIKDSFTPFLTRSPTDKKSLSVSAAFFSSKGNLWASYFSGDIAKINPDSGSLKLFSQEEERNVTDFTEDSEQRVWIATQNEGVFMHELTSDEFVQILQPNSCSNTTIEVLEIAIQNDSFLWIGSSGNGLYRMSLDTSICTRYDLPTFNDFTSKNSRIHEIVHDQATGNTWIASDQGLYIVDNFDAITHFNSENSSIGTNEVTSITLGPRDHLWVGTYSGLNIATKTSFEAFDEGIQKNLRAIIGIDGTPKRGTWVASYDGVLIYDELTGLHSELLAYYPEINFKNERIMSISVTDAEVWIGYRSTGLERFNFESNKLIIYNTESAVPLSSNAISAILGLQNGETLVGTYGGGLNILSANDTVEVMRQSDDDNSLKDDRVIVLYQARNGDVWVGTETGVQILNLQSKKFHSLQSLILGYEWPNERVVLSVRENDEGDYWLGTLRDGLFRLSREIDNSGKYSLSHYPVTGHSPSNTVYSVEVDKKNNVWASTNTGIFRLDRITDEIRNYSRSNGLIETEFEFGASHKDSKGRLYFGGSNGYNRFNPDDVDVESFPPPIVLTGLKIAGREPKLPVALRELELIELSHNDYYITLIFSALDFIDPAKNQFSYKLENFDPEWIDNSTRNSATYTSLPAGDYIFRVRGANSAGTWNMEGASIRIRVLPAPWFTWWAYLGYTIFALAIFLGITRVYHDRLITKKASVLAQKMSKAADRENDDLQEQLEIQDELLKSVYRHNFDTLDLLESIISLQSNVLDDTMLRQAIGGNRGRVLALTHLQRCMVYHGDAMFADFSVYVDSILGSILKTSPVPVESIMTINEVGKRLTPIEVATPLALIAFELLRNSIEHAFERSSPINYLQVSLEEDSAQQLLTLTVKDSGIGLPTNFSLSQADLSGLVIVEMIVDRLGGSMNIDSLEGTSISIIIPATGGLLIPLAGIQKFQA